MLCLCCACVSLLVVVAAAFLFLFFLTVSRRSCEFVSLRGVMMIILALRHWETNTQGIPRCWPQRGLQRGPLEGRGRGAFRALDGTPVWSSLRVLHEYALPDDMKRSFYVLLWVIFTPRHKLLWPPISMLIPIISPTHSLSSPCPPLSSDLVDGIVGGPRPGCARGCDQGRALHQAVSPAVLPHSRQQLSHVSIEIRIIKKLNKNNY